MRFKTVTEGIKSSSGILLGSVLFGFGLSMLDRMSPERINKEVSYECDDSVDVELGKTNLMNRLHTEQVHVSSNWKTILAGIGLTTFAGLLAADKVFAKYNPTNVVVEVEETKVDAEVVE